MSDAEKVNHQTPNLTDERLAQLAQIFPEAFSEGMVDFEKLRAALGDAVDTSRERYSFSWAGKQDAILSLQTPSRATLKPAPNESVDFDTTQNIFIEGENLEVLKLLYKSYFGRVKMIYIDPPYNTGNDFVYPDNYADPLDIYLRLTGQKNGNGDLLTSNPETNGRYHSAWLSMMYPRLFVARQLLRDDGVIFISIDDHESHNLRMLVNEIFGEEQFIADIAVVNNLKGRSDRANIATAHEHLLIYAKKDFTTKGLQLSEKQVGEYNQIDELNKRFQWRDLRKRGGADTRVLRPKLYFPLYFQSQQGTLTLEQQDASDIEIFPLKSDGTEGCWRWGKEKVAENLNILSASQSDRSGRWNVAYKVYLEAEGTQRRAKPKSVWIGSQYSTDLGQRSLKALIPDATIGSPPKAVGLLKEIVQQSATDQDICLDFFAGTCTTAQAVLELNRASNLDLRFIVVQLPEPTRQASYPTIAEIAKERIRRVSNKMKQEAAEQLDLSGRDTLEDLGFRVFKLAESNYKHWPELSPDTDPEEYARQMALFIDPLVDGFNVFDVIYEVAIKEGYGLTCRIEQAQEVTGADVYRVIDDDKGQFFTICLDNSLSVEALKPLRLARDHLFICRSVALDDTSAANLALQSRLKTI